MENFKKLSPRGRRFVIAFVETGFGAKAMRKIGFTGTRPEIAASKLRAKPIYKLAIAEYEAHVQGEDMERVFKHIRRLEMIETFDPRELVDEDGQYLPLHQWPDHVAAAIVGIEVEELFIGGGEKRLHIGRVKKYKVASKIEASKLLLQWKRQLSERHEHSGPDGTPLSPPVFNISFSDGGPGQSRPESSAAEVAGPVLPSGTDR